MNGKYLVDYPNGNVIFPTLVIAPGLRYAMDGIIFKQLVESLVEKGVLVARFNWSFFINDPVKGMPSDGFVSELRELQAVISKLRQDKRVDVSKIFVLGKSFGSVVAWNVFCADSSLAGAIILTPLCNGNIDHYPISLADSRPILLIGTENDPNTSLVSLNELANGLSGVVKMYVVSGNHNLECEGIQGVGCQLQEAQNFNQRIVNVGILIFAWMRSAMNLAA